MRHSLQGIILALSLGIAGAVTVRADSVGTTSSATLTAEGQLTTRTRAIVSGEYAYLLGQPEVVAADIKLVKFVPSPAQDAVLIAAYKSRPFLSVDLSSDRLAAPVGEINLIYWDVRTRVAKTLFREAVREDALVGIDQIEWLPQTSTALVVLSHVTIPDPQQPDGAQFVHSLVRVDTATGKVSRISSLATGMDVRYSAPDFVSASPSRPLAYIGSQQGTGKQTGAPFRTFLRVYTSQGLRPAISLPDGVSGFTWMSDGKSIYSNRITERDAEGKIIHRKALTVVNLETGKVLQPDSLPVIPITQRVREKPSPRSLWPIEVTSSKTAFQNPDGSPQETSTLWLRASAPQGKGVSPANAPSRRFAADSLLIAMDAHHKIELATEDVSTVLFTRDGSLCAAPIFRLSVTAFEEALRGVQRTTAISNAKVVGLALMGYLQDNEEKFPTDGSNLSDQLNPYVKNSEVFQDPATGQNGFVFTHKGPSSFADIANVETTQLGYVSGPGGRAVIWADGHVTWENN